MGGRGRKITAHSRSAWATQEAFCNKTTRRHTWGSHAELVRMVSTQPSKSRWCGGTERVYSPCPRILFSISSPGEIVSRLGSIICSEEHAGRHRNTYVLHLCRLNRASRQSTNSPSISQMLGNGRFSISSAYTFLSPLNCQNLECT